MRNKNIFIILFLIIFIISGFNLYKPFNVSADENNFPNRYEDLLRFFPENYSIKKLDTPLDENQIDSLILSINAMLSNYQIGIKINKFKPSTQFLKLKNTLTNSEYIYLSQIDTEIVMPPNDKPNHIPLTCLYSINNKEWITTITFMPLTRISFSNGFCSEINLKAMGKDLWGPVSFALYKNQIFALVRAHYDILIQEDLTLFSSLAIWNNYLREFPISEEYKSDIVTNKNIIPSFDELEKYLPDNASIRSVESYKLTDKDKAEIRKSFEKEINYYNDFERKRTEEDTGKLFPVFVPDWATFAIKYVGETLEITTKDNKVYFLIRTMGVSVEKFRTDQPRLRLPSGTWVGLTSFLSFSDSDAFAGIRFYNIESPINSYNIYCSFYALHNLCNVPLPDENLLLLIRSLMIKFPIFDLMYI